MTTPDRTPSVPNPTWWQDAGAPSTSPPSGPGIPTGPGSARQPLSDGPPPDPAAPSAGSPAAQIRDKTPLVAVAVLLAVVGVLGFRAGGDGRQMTVPAAASGVASDVGAGDRAGVGADDGGTGGPARGAESAPSNPRTESAPSAPTRESAPSAPTAEAGQGAGVIGGIENGPVVLQAVGVQILSTDSPNGPGFHQRMFADSSWQFAPDGRFVFAPVAGRVRDDVFPAPGRWTRRGDTIVVEVAHQVQVANVGSAGVRMTARIGPDGTAEIQFLSTSGTGASINGNDFATASARTVTARVVLG